MTQTDLPIQWYVAREGQQYGPLSADEMRLFVQGGHLKTTDLIWRPGFENWRAATEVFPPADDNPDFGDQKGASETAAASADRESAEPASAEPGQPEPSLSEPSQTEPDGAADEADPALEAQADETADVAESKSDAGEAKAVEGAGKDAVEAARMAWAGSHRTRARTADNLDDPEEAGATAAPESGHPAGPGRTEPGERATAQPAETGTRTGEEAKAADDDRPSNDESSDEDPVTQPMGRFDQVAARGPARPHTATQARDNAPGEAARAAPAAEGEGSGSGRSRSQPEKTGQPAVSPGRRAAGPSPGAPDTSQDPRSGTRSGGPHRPAAAGGVAGSSATAPNQPPTGQPPTGQPPTGQPPTGQPRSDATSPAHPSSGPTMGRQEPRGLSAQFDAYGRPVDGGGKRAAEPGGGERELGRQIGYAPGPHDLGPQNFGPPGSAYPGRGSAADAHPRPGSGYGQPQPAGIQGGFSGGIPGQQRPAPHIPVGGNHRTEAPRNRAGLGRLAGVITALVIVSGLSYATYANREKLNAFISQSGVFGELTQGNQTASETVKAGSNRGSDVAMLSKDPVIEEPAPPKPAVDPVIALDEEFQKSPLWKIIKRDFPDWYAARLREVASSSAQKTETDVTAQLIKKLVDLRRKNAGAALHSSPEQLRNMAQAFLVNLRSLEGHSTTACFSFISRGESSPEVMKLFPDETYGKPIEQQIAAIFLAISNGKASPVKRQPASKPDYDILAQELSKLGWSPNDLKLFADPSALAKAEPAKVCNMVQDWFQAHIAIEDTEVQERLLFETLRPVVAG